MPINESIVEDAALEWFGEQSRVAPTLTRPLPRGEERRRLPVRCAQTGGQSLQILQQFKPEWR